MIILKLQLQIKAPKFKNSNFPPLQQYPIPVGCNIHIKSLYLLLNLINYITQIKEKDSRIIGEVNYSISIKFLAILVPLFEAVASTEVDPADNASIYGFVRAHRFTSVVCLP